MSAVKHPRERDPRQFPFGLYLVEAEIFGGVNGFHWFRAESEAAEYLRNGVWLELSHWDEFFPGVRPLYQNALRDRCDISDAWLGPVQAQQGNLLVVWYGTFRALLDGKDSMSAEILNIYAESPEARDAETQDATPFIAFLRRYFA